MHNLNKKGMSSIIQITLLMALGVMAISLVWGYVIDLSGDLGKQLSPTVDCIAQSSNAVSACVTQDGQIELNIEEGLGEEINYASINFKGESFVCGNTCSSCIVSDISGRKTIYLDPTTEVFNQDALTVGINGCLAKSLIVNPC